MLFLFRKSVPTPNLATTCLKLKKSSLRSGGKLTNKIRRLYYFAVNYLHNSCVKYLDKAYISIR